MKIENNGHPENTFDLEERYDHELTPLIREVCEKASEIGVPVFIVACYKADDKGSSWLASSARSRENGFVPKEFYLIRAVVEGHVEVTKLSK